MSKAVEEYVEIELQEKLFSVRESWHVLKPFLNEVNVQNVLNKAMTDFCEEYHNEWQPGNAPWEYTTSDYWHMKICDATQEDEEYQKEQAELFQKLYDSNQDEDDLWNELLGTEEYTLLENKYNDKYAPKENTIEWYQFIHGCHWINEFTAALIEKSLNVDVLVWKTTKHTCATFVKDDVIYFADILQEWENLQELLDFMAKGEEVDCYPIFDN